MATDTPLLTRTRVGAAAVETTTGTAATVGASQGVFNMFDLKMTGVAPPTERQAEGSLTALAPIPGALSGTMAFKTEVYNAASTPTWLSVLLVACGWAVNTGVYSPLTGAATTITIGLYQGGSRHKRLAGCQGTFKIMGEAGKPMMIEWTFTGKWVTPSTVSIIAPVYPTTVPPRFAGATLTVGGTAYRVSKFEFDMGNTIKLREDVNDSANSTNTGYHSAFCVGRKPVISIDPEALALGTQDWYAAHLASTTYAFNCVVGSGSNGTITFAAAAVQPFEMPQDGDRGGLHVDELKLLCTSTSADGEATITPS